MTATFWTLYLPVLAALLGLSLLTRVILSTLVRPWHRRRQVRKEMARLKHLSFNDAVVQLLSAEDRKIYKAHMAHAQIDAQQRRQLANAATSQDRYSRKVH